MTSVMLSSIECGRAAASTRSSGVQSGVNVITRNQPGIAATIFFVAITLAPVLLIYTPIRWVETH